MAMTTATDDAVQMLQAGWTVRYLEGYDAIEWRSPDGISGSEFRSESLDNPPLQAVQRARDHGHIQIRYRVPC